MAENPLFEDLNKRAEQEPAPTTDLVEQPQKQLVSEQELSQIRQRQEQLKQQPQVQQLAEKIDVKNQIAVLEFGKETAQGISTFSDRMLATIKQSNLEKSTTLLNNLNKIMDRFDPQDFQEEQKKAS